MFEVPYLVRVAQSLQRPAEMMKKVNVGMSDFALNQQLKYGRWQAV